MFKTFLNKSIKTLIIIGYRLLDIFFLHGSRKKPKKDFEENPLTMSWKSVLYLGYKYLYQPHTITNDEKYTIEYFRQQQIPFTDKKPKKTELILHFAGDMKQHYLFSYSTTKHLRDDIENDFFGGDIVIANLETPLNTKYKTQKDPFLMVSNIYFNARKTFYNMITNHQKWKYTLLLTANNHCLDQGEMGHKATCNFLKKHKVAYTGSRTSPFLPRYTLLSKKGINIAILNYTFSCNAQLPSKKYAFAINYLRLNKGNTDISQIRKEVQKAKKAGADIVIFCPHMGNAYQLYPSGHIVRMVHRFFDECGVDAVIATHPHNLQPMEMYSFTDPFTGEKKQGFVIYSLGDFVSYDIFPRSHMGAYLQLRYIKKANKKVILSGVQLIPVYMHKSVFNHQIHFRLVNLKKLIQQITSGKIPKYLTKSGKKEAQYLWNLLQEHILPQ